jgi:hypothetical protein
MAETRSKRSWTSQDDNLFRRMAEANASPEVIAAKLNRSVPAIKTRAYLKARRRIDEKLADKGCDAAEILSMALNEAAECIDAIDRRIATYELRRMTALRSIQNYSETLAPRLKAVSSEVIEGEFTEAAE